MDPRDNTPSLDDRLFKETGIEARLATLLIPSLENLGFRLVRIHLSQLNGQTLQIMVERPDGQISVQECEQISRTISPLLDVEDLISGKYHLEVSSPGIDRPLVRKCDFFTWEGALGKFETNELIQERKRFRGFICHVNDDSFTVKAEQITYDGAEEITILFSQLDNARLILTDDLIRAALKQEKEAQKNASSSPNHEDETKED